MAIVRNDRRRKQALVRWRMEAPQFTPEELLDGTGDFVLTSRDKTILSDILEHNYLASRHLLTLGHFKTRNGASKRMSRLVQQGVVAEASVSSWSGDQQIGWEHAFALTSAGFECLVLSDNYDAARVAGRWTPPFLAGGSRNNVIHDVVAADLCLSIVERLRDDVRHPYWVSAKAAVMQLPRSVALGVERKYISPDGLVMIPETGEMILVEFEQSARSDTLDSKMRGYAEFFSQKAWTKDYQGARPPKVILSLSSESDRQRYWFSPFDQGRTVGSQFVVLYPNLFVVNESYWHRGLWEVLPLAKGSGAVALRNAVLDDEIN
ncbi:MAG: replication-relaxation family protein [Thermaerobacter sp.]|nr:replication-relaxation family protein [Thermaerobacter sp.]